LIKKISDKDKKDWESFIKNDEKIPNKDFFSKKKIISGDDEKIKTVHDTWIFSKDVNSSNPNWLLIDTIT